MYAGDKAEMQSMISEQERKWNTNAVDARVTDDENRRLYKELDERDRLMEIMAAGICVCLCVCVFIYMFTNVIEKENGRSYNELVERTQLKEIMAATVFFMYEYT